MEQLLLSSEQLLRLYGVGVFAYAISIFPIIKPTSGPRLLWCGVLATIYATYDWSVSGVDWFYAIIWIGVAIVAYLASYVLLQFDSS